MGGTHSSQSPPDSTSLLRPEVKGEVLLVLVELAEVLALLSVNNGKDAGNRLADGGADRQGTGSARKMKELK